EMAREADISGKVYVNFIIDENGNVLKSTILNGIGYGCNEEALRVIKLMPKWTPGMNNGKRVKVSFNQIIYFMLKH
ncbi:MAG: energy transducer TonB, partial [Bacteroidia bacterium]